MRPLIDTELTLAGPDSDDLLEALDERFELRREETAERRSTYWDTFDWRLWKDGGVLALQPASDGDDPADDQAAQDRRRLTWRERDGRLKATAELAGDALPGFADELPEPLAELAPVLSMRRLMPVLHLRERGPLLRVLDASQKTVVRLRVIHADAARGAETPPNALPARVRVEPVRGYPDDEAEVLAVLEGELGLERVEQSLVQTALEALGRSPGDYSSKVRLHLDPSATALDAALSIYRVLFDNMLTNEPGTRADVDSEFLHDYRVAVRRTRSALSQIKGVFKDDVVEHFKQEFRWVGQITGPTRDLDVYLLKMPAYRADLAPEIQDHLAPLGRLLAERQRQAQRQLVRNLDSPRYAALLEDWRRQLSRPAAGPAAGRAAIEVASARIFKLYKRLVKTGRAIDDETPAERLHDVRILGKKLRYLMEFFRSLYPPAEIDVAISELKRLQDNLGDFNDYEVQEAAMGHFAEELAGGAAASGEDAVHTLLAMGRLQAHLDDGRRRERRRFHKRFERFASGLNRRRFEALFVR